MSPSGRRQRTTQARAAHPPRGAGSRQTLCRHRRRERRGDNSRQRATRGSWGRAAGPSGFRCGLGTGGGWSGADFTVDFMLIDVGQELVSKRLAPSSSKMRSAARRGGRRFCQ